MIFPVYLNIHKPENSYQLFNLRLRLRLRPHHPHHHYHLRRLLHRHRFRHHLVQPSAHSRPGTN